MKGEIYNNNNKQAGKDRREKRLNTHLRIFCHFVVFFHHHPFAGRGISIRYRNCNTRVNNIDTKSGGVLDGKTILLKNSMDC
jgi:hypothetical protein